MRGRRAIVLLCALVLVLAAAGVGGYAWWRHRAPENEPISESLCDGMLQTHAISQAIGVQAVDGFVDERGDVFYFDCEIRFEELGGIRVSYLVCRTFSGRWRPMRTILKLWTHGRASR